MSWQCPTCGSQNQETFNACACGYSNNGNNLIKQELSENHRIAENSEQHLDIPSESGGYQTALLTGQSEGHTMQTPKSSGVQSSVPDEQLIKEIDSWLFTFSRADNCICIGTPALQSFRLKISAEELESLLELLYEKTGQEKTIRKVNLSAADIIGVIDKVDRLIDEKKSKISVKFTSEELQQITEFINLQLKV